MPGDCARRHAVALSFLVDIPGAHPIDSVKDVSEELTATDTPTEMPTACMRIGKPRMGPVAKPGPMQVGFARGDAKRPPAVAHASEIWACEHFPHAFSTSRLNLATSRLHLLKDYWCQGQHLNRCPPGRAGPQVPAACLATKCSQILKLGWQASRHLSLWQ